MQLLIQCRLIIFLVILLLPISGFAAENIPNVEGGYQDGFYIKTPDDKFLLKVGTRFDFGYTHGLVSPQKDFSSFDIYHAKFFAGGNAFGRYIQYYVQAGAASNSRQPSFAPPAESGDGGFTLEDYYVRFSKEGFNFKFGQFKTPFGRQWMTYSGNFQFVDRSLVSYFHQFGRDRGVTFNGTRETFAFSLGVFNGGGSPSMGSGLSPRTFSGNGQNVSNDTAGGGRGHLYLARIVAMPFKTTGYSEGDVALSEGARLDWGVGVAFDHDRDVDINGDAVVDDVDADVLAVGTDLVFKRDGLSAQAEFFYRDIRGNTAVDSHGLGAYIQTGYFFIASQFETALRFGFIEPDMDTSDDQILEGAAALNLYIFRDHRYKTQLQYTWRGQDTALGGRNDDHFVDLLFQFTI